eukprot:13163536-Heterocapsa_arctica.AAC.1
MPPSGSSPVMSIVKLERITACISLMGAGYRMYMAWVNARKPMSVTVVAGTRPLANLAMGSTSFAMYSEKLISYIRSQ